MRYYFDLSDGSREPDETGLELADDRAAQWEAIRFCGEVLRYEPHRLEAGRLRVDVRDEASVSRFVIDVVLRMEAR